MESIIFGVLSIHWKNGYGHWNGNDHDKRCLRCTPWSLWKYVFQMWIERRIWKYIWIMALYNLWICLKVMEGGVCILGAIQHYLTYFNQSTTYKCKECETKSQWKNHGKSIWKQFMRIFAIFTLLCTYCKNAIHAEKNVENHMKIVHEEFLLCLHFFVYIAKKVIHYETFLRDIWI